MSSVVDRITEVLEQHYNPYESGYSDALECCIEAGLADHPAHVAAVIQDALALLFGEDLWKAHECVLYWRESDNCDDTPEYQQSLKELAKRLHDAANELAVGLPSQSGDTP